MKRYKIVISALFLGLLLVGLFLISGCGQEQVDTGKETSSGESNTVIVPDTAEEPEIIKETPKTYSVGIENFAFSPKEIRIKKGDTITWTNEDSAPHTVTSDTGDELDSQRLNTGQTYTHKFNEKGTFSYYCAIHPSMKGKVIVE